VRGSFWVIFDLEESFASGILGLEWEKGVDAS